MEHTASLATLGTSRRIDHQQRREANGCMFLLGEDPLSGLCLSFYLGGRTRTRVHLDNHQRAVRARVLIDRGGGGGVFDPSQPVLIEERPHEEESAGLL